MGFSIFNCKKGSCKPGTGTTIDAKYSHAALRYEDGDVLPLKTSAIWAAARLRRIVDARGNCCAAYE